jgi:hypothetical protein
LLFSDHLCYSQADSSQGFTSNQTVYEKLHSTFAKTAMTKPTRLPGCGTGRLSPRSFTAFVRVSAVLKFKVDDYYHNGAAVKKNCMRRTTLGLLDWRDQAIIYGCNTTLNESRGSSSPLKMSSI